MRIVSDLENPFSIHISMKTLQFEQIVTQYLDQLKSPLKIPVKEEKEKKNNQLIHRIRHSKCCLQHS